MIGDAFPIVGTAFLIAAGVHNIRRRIQPDGQLVVVSLGAGHVVCWLAGLHTAALVLQVSMVSMACVLAWALFNHNRSER